MIGLPRKKATPRTPGKDSEKKMDSWGGMHNNVVD